jgi:hypothetical protein
MTSIDLPGVLFLGAELARFGAFVLALAIGVVPGLAYRPIRPLALVLGTSIAVDAGRRFIVWPAMDEPSTALASTVFARVGAVPSAASSDLALVLLGLLLPGAVVWITFAEPESPGRDVLGWGFLWFVLYGFFVLPYPAPWTVDPGYAYALAGVVNVTLAPGAYAFVSWIRRRRRPRVEHVGAVGILLAHLGLCTGPYWLFSPNPYGAHTAYSVVLYGLAFVATIGGEVSWLKHRFGSRSSRRS